MAWFNLGRELERQKLSMGGFARMLGVRPQAITKFFNPGFNPSASTLMKWCSVLNCTLEDLLDKELNEEDRTMPRPGLLHATRKQRKKQVSKLDLPEGLRRFVINGQISNISDSHHPGDFTRVLVRPGDARLMIVTQGGQNICGMGLEKARAIIAHRKVVELTWPSFWSVIKPHLADIKRYIAAGPGQL